MNQSLRSWTSQCPYVVFQQNLLITISLISRLVCIIPREVFQFKRVILIVPIPFLTPIKLDEIEFRSYPYIPEWYILILTVLQKDHRNVDLRLNQEILSYFQIYVSIQKTCRSCYYSY